MSRVGDDDVGVWSFKQVHAQLLQVSLPLRSANPATVFLLALAVGVCTATGLFSSTSAPPEGYAAMHTSVPLVTETSTPETTTQHTDNTTLAFRLERVREMMQHTWAGYKECAWGHDELSPVSCSHNDKWGGFGITLVDSLDTLILMGMTEELAEARRFVAEINYGASDAGALSVFELTIRHVGGLLSAYTLTGDKLYLDKAVSLADLLLPAFNTPSGVPVGEYNMYTKRYNIDRANPCLAEAGSLQMEFSYLSIITNNSVYADTANRFFETVFDMQESTGIEPIKDLVPLHFNSFSGDFTDELISFGGQGDSYYEYLLKLWILDGKRDPWLRKMYDRSVAAMKRHLIFYTRNEGVMYLANSDHGEAGHTMEHLTCFVPGMLALGAEGPADLNLAERLGETCHKMYSSTASGLGAEILSFEPHTDEFLSQDASYILRPETLESMFLLWRKTKNPKYRDWAWDMFLAIERNCKTTYGYSGVTNVDMRRGGALDDRMESFFIAETIKYLFLIFSDDDVLDLNEYVLTTEAHPFRIQEN